MSTCPDCGADVAESQRFCHECWGSLDGPNDGGDAPSVTTSTESTDTSVLPSWVGGRAVKVGVGVIALVVVVAVVTLGIGGMIVDGGSGNNTTSNTGYNTSQVQAEAIQMEYDTLFRNIGSHHGDSVRYQGELIRMIQNGEGEYTFIVNVAATKENRRDTISVQWEGERFLEGDIVAFSGVVEGVRTYTTPIGVRKTVPKVTAVSMEIAG